MNPNKSRLIFPAKIAIFVVVIFCIVEAVSLNMEYSSLSSELEEKESKIAYYTDKVEEMKNKCEEPFDEEYIVRVAREKLNLARPEEIYFYNDLEK